MSICSWVCWLHTILFKSLSIIRHWTPLRCFFVCADINLTADALDAKTLTDLFRPMSCDGSGSSGWVVPWRTAEDPGQNRTLSFVITTIARHSSTTWKSGRTPMTRAFGSYLDCTTFQVKRSDFSSVVSPNNWSVIGGTKFDCYKSYKMACFSHHVWRTRWGELLRISGWNLPSKTRGMGLP